MSFYEVYKHYKQFDYDGFYASLTGDAIRSAMDKPKKGDFDLLAMLSPQACLLYTSRCV